MSKTQETASAGVDCGLFTPDATIDYGLLKSASLFADFFEAEIHAFVRDAERHQAEVGEVMLAAGTRNDSIFILCRGRALVTVACRHGDMPVAGLDPGQTFGEMSFVDGSPTTATVTASAPCETLELSHALVNRLIEGQPALAVKLWRNLAIELRRRLALTSTLVDRHMDIYQSLAQDPDLHALY